MSLSKRLADLVSIGALVVLAAGRLGAAPPPVDPCETLLQTLRAPVTSLAERERTLRCCANQITTFSDLRRVLLLNEWYENDVDHDRVSSDLKVRAELEERFVRAVREALRNAPTPERLAVLSQLSELGDHWRSKPLREPMLRRFGADVAQLAEQGETRVRIAAIGALWRVEPQVDKTLTVLGRQLESAEPALRLAAAEALVGLMRAAAACDDSSHPVESVPAASHLGLTLGRQIVPVALIGMGDTAPEVRRGCAGVLELCAAQLNVEQSAAPAEPHAMTAYNPDEAFEAARFALVVALDDAGALLSRGVEDSEVSVRRAVVATLGEMVRFEARQASTAGASPSAAALTSRLNANLVDLGAATVDQSPQVALAAVEALESLGPMAGPAAPMLARALSSSDRFTRWAAVRALGRLGPTAPADAVAGLSRALADPDVDVSRAAAEALERLGPTAARATPMVLRLLSSDDVQVRLGAVRVLGSIGPQARMAVPLLCTALTDDNASIRSGAAEALAAMGKDARAAREPLSKALEDRDARVREAAGTALLKIGWEPR